MTKYILVKVPDGDKVGMIRRLLHNFSQETGIHLGDCVGPSRFMSKSDSEELDKIYNRVLNEAKDIDRWAGRRKD